MWAAILGPNLQEGVDGFVNTIAEALRDLANQIERGRWESVNGKLPLMALGREDHADLSLHHFVEDRSRQPHALLDRRQNLWHVEVGVLHLRQPDCDEDRRRYRDH